MVLDPDPDYRSHYAVNTRSKLVVAAAGNDDTYETTNAYPAALSTTFPDKVLAVAASGMWTDPTMAHLKRGMRYNGLRLHGRLLELRRVDLGGCSRLGHPLRHSGMICRATCMTSTGAERHDDMSGTSMATPFVAASAARRWGFTPGAAGQPAAPSNIIQVRDPSELLAPGILEPYNQPTILKNRVG